LKSKDHYVTFDPVVDTYNIVEDIGGLEIWDYHYDPDILLPKESNLQCVKLSDTEITELKKKFNPLV